jgi:hypothetical protein
MNAPTDSGSGSPCPGRDLLSAFSVGDLPADLQQAIAGHLGRCAGCVATREDAAGPFVFPVFFSLSRG